MDRRNTPSVVQAVQAVLDAAENLAKELWSDNRRDEEEEDLCKAVQELCAAQEESLANLDRGSLVARAYQDMLFLAHEALENAGPLSGDDWRISGDDIAKWQKAATAFRAMCSQKTETKSKYIDIALAAGEIDPRDPKNHGHPIWVTTGPACCPSIVCAQLLAYSATHALLPVGRSGPIVCIWGYSVYRRVPGFRTLGKSIEELDSAIFWRDQFDALDYLRVITTPRKVK